MTPLFTTSQHQRTIPSVKPSGSCLGRQIGAECAPNIWGSKLFSFKKKGSKNPEKAGKMQTAFEADPDPTMSYVMKRRHTCRSWNFVHHAGSFADRKERSFCKKPALKNSLQPNNYRAFYSQVGQLTAKLVRFNLYRIILKNDVKKMVPGKILVKCRSITNITSRLQIAAKATLKLWAMTFTAAVAELQDWRRWSWATFTKENAPGVLLRC